MKEKEIIFTVEDSNEGGFEAKALGFAIFTEAENLDQLRKNIREAVLCHFEENELPSIIRLRCMKDELLSVSHNYSG
jgi:hypothetical protein